MLINIGHKSRGSCKAGILILICMINDKRRDRKLAKLAQGADEASLNTATSAEDLAKMGYFEDEKTS